MRSIAATTTPLINNLGAVCAPSGASEVGGVIRRKHGKKRETETMIVNYHSPYFAAFQPSQPSLSRLAATLPTTIEESTSFLVRQELVELSSTIEIDVAVGERGWGRMDGPHLHQFAGGEMTIEWLVIGI